MRGGGETKDPLAARKVQKADREKLRRDQLSEHFLELGHTLDPYRPKNDKVTILTDTIQVLKDLTAEVSKLKAEYTAISEESRELMQEKNELQEEKSSLKSAVENLNVQYQQRFRVVYPWGPMDPSSLVMAPTPTYSYSGVPMAMPPLRTIPLQHPPPLQPALPFFGNHQQNPSSMSSPCSTFIPFSTPLNPAFEQQYASSSRVSGKPKSKTNKLLDRQSGSTTEQNSNDVATELQLKMPGSSSTPQSTKEKQGKHTQRNEKNSLVSSSSGISCMWTPQEGASSDSVGDEHVVSI